MVRSIKFSKDRLYLEVCCAVSSVDERVLAEFFGGRWRTHHVISLMLIEMERVLWMIRSIQLWLRVCGKHP